MEWLPPATHSFEPKTLCRCSVLPVMAGYVFAIHTFAANFLCRCIVLPEMVGCMSATHTFTANSLCREAMIMSSKYGTPEYLTGK